MKKEHKFNPFASISAKILILMTLIILVSLNVCTMIAKDFAKNRLTSSQTDALAAVAAEKSIAIEQYVASQKNIAKLIKANETIITQGKIFAESGTINPASQNVIAATLAQIAGDNNNIYENLFVTYGSTGYADCLGNATLHDVAEEPFYQECLKNGYFFGVNVSPVTGEPVYVIAYAINDFQGNFIGTVNMSISMKLLGADIISSGGYDVTVLDLNGYVIATSNDSSSILTNIKDDDPVGFQAMLDNKSGITVLDLTRYGIGLTYIAFVVSDNFIMEASLLENVITVPVVEMSRNLSFVSIFLTVLSVILMAVLVIFIVKPLKNATSDIEVLANDIADGHGDLTKKIAVKSKDEIGVLVTSVNNLISTMDNIISSVQDNTSLVSNASNEINLKIENSKAELTNVSATMEEMSASSEETSASMTQVMQQVDSVAQLITGVADESTTNVSYAASVVKKVDDIRSNAAKEREEGTAHLNEVAATLRQKINNAKQVQEIANLTTEILSITSQTNLLSLNASIEAARAGEAGKGFAVVADEIRQLADSSKEAANRIQEVTENVILAVEALATEAESVTEFMLQNNEETLETTNRLTDAYSSDIQKLAEVMESFKSSSDDIKSSMDVIKEAIDAVNIAAEETAQGITDVAQSTVELTNELQSVAEMANENLETSTELSDRMSKFTV